MTSDGALIEKIKQDDMAAFNALFKAYYIQLYYYCRKFVSDPEEAKDLMQNVFLRFWERRADLDIHTSIKAYLYRSVQNECLNHLRSSKNLVSMSHDDDDTPTIEVADAHNTPDDELAALEIEQITQTVIDQLPEQCQKVFTLSRLKGLKSQEIAEHLNISVRTVDTQIYRALKILKMKLKDYLAP
ncbi:MAG: RNA polymerase sigma-70 factor [Tannerellaceae bacterium]